VTDGASAGFTEYLAGLISPHRRERVEQVLAHRTRWLTAVLEDVYQPHNASAVLRSCEALGLQDVHVIESRNRYQVNPQVDLGASRWLTVRRYPDLANCVQALRERGYRLLAASPHEDGQQPEQVEVSRPLAVLLGTEEEGLSPAAVAAADGCVRVPMYGFTESLNVSVCAALILRALSRRLRLEPTPWELTESERAELRLEWYRRSVRGADLLEARFREDEPDPA
jgi:tRNA (guanosine-2'-O-)-methyltransferase